jgi:GNAT superfamily N-acetyltransferase
MLEIRQIPMGGPIDDFLNLVDYIYRGDSAYVRPLDMELRDRLSPRKNPFFDHAEGAMFCAYRNGWCVGRITAQVDREHLERHKDSTGFFGFFDTIDDEEVAQGLLSRAENWLKGKGLKRARGPMSLNVNEEIGCLIEGFDTPPYIMMPHHRPYQGALVEKAGYAKVKDLFAWKYKVGEPNVRVKRAHDEIKSLREVTYRGISLKNLQHDVELLVDVFNDSWGENWGFVPFTRREVQKMASDFRLLLMPEITRVVTIDGEPAAVALAVPNLNELVRDLHGKLLPVGLPKLLWRLKVRGPQTARLVLLGIRKKWRNVRKYAGLSAFMYAEMNDGGRKLGIREGELGWTLEDNGRVNAGIQLMGAKIYKRYRVYDKNLTSGE